MPDPSPHGSLTMYDPNSCDLNVQTQVADREQRASRIEAFYRQHVGQLLYLKHAQHGNIKPVVITPIGPGGRAGWVWCEHILCGMWRVASPQDVAAWKTEQAAKAEQGAAIEARRLAKGAGLGLEQIAENAARIVEFKKALDEKDKAIAAIPPPAAVEEPPVRAIPPDGPRCEDVAEPVEEAPPPPVEPPAPRPRGRRKKAQP